MPEVNESLYQHFQKVFEQHYNALCNYALSFTKAPATSEDIVQEVFIRIWEKKKEMIHSETIRFYLFTAVRNNCLTYLQKEKKSATVALNENSVPEETTGVAEHNENSKDYKKHLRHAIAQLPPKCREVFLLSRLSQQSYKEIAESLDISVKTVENQIGKALKIIREYVKDQKVLLLAIAILINLLTG